MKQFYQIHELAKLFDLCPDTLRYYEEKGLLHPVRGENRYRMYGIQDVCTLNIIRALRELSLPTRAIRAYLERRSVGETLSLLNREEALLRRRMAELDVTAFVQPVFINGDMHIAPGRLGGNRLAHSYAWGDMERLGLHMAFGTDCPVERVHPLRGSTAPSPGGTSPETAPSCRSRPLRPTRRCTLIPQAALTPPVRSASKGAYAPACWPTSSWWTATC